MRRDAQHIGHPDVPSHLGGGLANPLDTGRTHIGLRCIVQPLTGEAGAKQPRCAEKRDNNDKVAILIVRCRKDPVKRFASVSEVKSQLSQYLALLRRKREPIVVTRHGKPYALIQPFSEQDLEELEWKGLAKERLARAWEGEADGLYDYL